MIQSGDNPETASQEPSPPSMSDLALFLRFLGFGCRAFGGPVAQIAMIRRELVDRERWLSSDRFNRLLAIMQILPGPEAHELCVHLGIRARGRWGGVLAGAGFMLPGLVLMLLLSWLYFRLDFDRSWVAAAFLGAQAAVLALILRAILQIGRHIVVDRALWVICGLSAVGAVAGVDFWIVLPTAGLGYALLSRGRRALCAMTVIAGVATALSQIAAGAHGLAPVSGPDFAADAPGDVSAAALWASGLKAGLLTFGGAYAAIPFLRDDAVGRGWMSDGQFLDGVAMAGMLPAPLIIFAVFVGYVAGGPYGALAMTAGVFLPAFAFSMIFYDRLERLVEAEELKAGLAGVAAGVVGLIAATGLDLTIRLLTPLDQAFRPAAIALASLAGLHVLKGRFAPPAVLATAAVVAVISA